MRKWKMVEEDESSDRSPPMRPAPRPRLIHEATWFVLCLLVYAVLGLVLFGGTHG